MNHSLAQASTFVAVARRRVIRWCLLAGTWIGGMSRNPRRAALVGCAVILLVPSGLSPLSRGDVVDSVQFSLAFFATLLTGEAVIFALSFSPSSPWPSLKEIDAHISFREWVVVGWLASMLTATGLLTRTTVPGVYGALLFLLSDVFGMFSFIRLFGIAGADGRKAMLTRTLANALDRVSVPVSGLPRRMRDEQVLGAFLGQVDDAVARSDGNGVRDLAGELAAAAKGRTDAASIMLNLDVTHRLAKSALLGKLDALVATTAASELVRSLLGQVAELRHGDGTSGAQAHRAGSTLAVASRYLAWLGSVSLTLATRGVTTSSAAREMIAFSVRGREAIMQLADPDPKYISGTHEIGTPLADLACVLAWISGFTEFHGSSQAAGFYSVYEILTGTKFMGNYWDGDSILARLRDALFSASRVDSAAATATRRCLGSVGEFDRAWTLVSVNALATFRDVRVVHPPELIRPEFTPDRQLLGAYLRTFASHRYFSSADGAMTALLRLVGRSDEAGNVWHTVGMANALLTQAIPIPVTHPHERPSACALAIACRLAPLAPDEPDRELRAFLDALPGEIQDATARLALRTLPPLDDEQATASQRPAGLIADRLRVLQLVGTHRSSASLT